MISPQSQINLRRNQFGRADVPFQEKKIQKSIHLVLARSHYVFGGASNQLHFKP